jgi:hypothetical protein
MKFEINTEQSEKLRSWYEGILPEILEKQQVNHLRGVPYYGAIGGGLTYCFTPTGLGCILVVKEFTTSKELDLTDYENW